MRLELNFPVGGNQALELGAEHRFPVPGRTGVESTFVPKSCRSEGGGLLCVLGCAKGGSQAQSAAHWPQVVIWIWGDLYAGVVSCWFIMSCQQGQPSLACHIH